ncbi:glycosyltransferase involved in cell wall biosynthesis [Winogradskyella pacifica]|uniref:Glycosyltransferase involved in cell wall biosynthesis n=1 Tax=Winogradskyella pacifica TaxID=664642 RepID=A0A3D9MZ93_9FLAO|nr:glycosyltransferase family 2 protein [Winogradskyella pacifica]REE24458.1 glycosyltransferase involved in cell wall biosynthesis [Winogradskyella pacifica]
MKKDLVSIIIPTYNRAHLIGETIASIQRQTYTNWECIIVDDSSTDNTEKILLNYIEKDKRIAFYHKPDNLLKGPSASRNFGFIKSNGTYINWLDSDDVMHPEKLETDLKNIQSGDFDFTISQSAFFKDDGKPSKKYWNKNLWSDDPINDFILKKIGWGINNPLWKRDSLINSDLKFDEDLITADDYMYHIQVLLFKLKPNVNQEVLVFNREHGNRLNDFGRKAPFKLKNNIYLMKNKESFTLNDDVKAFLNRQYIRQVSNLLKNKDIKLARNYIKNKNLKFYDLKTNTEVRMLYFKGLIFKLTGIGYEFLKVK